MMNRADRALYRRVQWVLSVALCFLASSAHAGSISLSGNSDLKNLSGLNSNNLTVTVGTGTPHLSGEFELKFGSPGLEIYGTAAVNTLTLNLNGSYGYFLVDGSGDDLFNLNNIILTGAGGGGHSAIDGSTSTAPLFTINTTGMVSISGNSCASGSGGCAIQTSNSLLINGSLTANNNVSSNNAGGALNIGTQYASDPSQEVLTITGGVSMDSNSSRDAGGAINVNNGGASLATSGGDVSFTNNISNGTGGGIHVAYDVAIGNAAAPGLITFTGNVSGYNNPSSHGAGAIAAPSGTVTLNGSTITLSNNTANVSGALGGGGIYATNVAINGAMTANNNTVSGGSGGGGAIYALRDVTLTATGGDMTLTSNAATNGSGGAIWTGGNATLNATGGNISFSGNTASGALNALWLDNTGSAATATFNTASGQTITFHDPIANNAANGLVTVNSAGAGTVIFDNAQTSSIYGNTTVQSGAFAVRGGASYGVLGGSPTSFTVAPGATLAGGGTGTVTTDTFILRGTLDVAGITLGQSAGTSAGGFSTFNIVSGTGVGGGVTFQAGSQVLFDTYLNDGGSQLTDLLALSLGSGGTVTGQANVIVANSGGHGAATVNDGIRIVHMNSGTSNGAFTLGQRVAVGIYEYFLRQVNGDWYLQTNITLPLSSGSPGGGGGGGGQAATVVFHPYRSEVPTDTVVPALASRYGLDLLGTWHDRNGGAYANPDVNADFNFNFKDGETLGWARVFGQSGRSGPGGSHSFDRHHRFDQSGATYDFDYSGLQAGMDLWRKTRADGSRDVAGVYVAAGHARADVRSLLTADVRALIPGIHSHGSKAGTVSMDALTFAGYATRVNAEGAYLDAVLQGTHYRDATAKSTQADGYIRTRGLGLLASLEGGYPFTLAPGWKLEPQAQLVWQYLSLDDRSDVNKTVRVSFPDSNAFYGRLGARFVREVEHASGRKFTVWARANLWSDFGSNTRTKFDHHSFDTRLGGNWGQVDLGISGQISKRVTLYVKGDYNWGVNNSSNSSHSAGGMIGVKMGF